MDRHFLAYYQTELKHLRQSAEDFARAHPLVARNLLIDQAPCPDPYVERLLEGVAYLGARTRMKLDLESTRHVRRLLDALYPDLVAPSPAMAMARLSPGPQVDSMVAGHRVAPGTRLVAGLRAGTSTRAVYTTSQPVDLWPLRVAAVDCLQDRAALKSAGLSADVLGDAEVGLRVTLERTSPGPIAELSLDRLDIWLGDGARGGALFDALVGHGRGIVARTKRGPAKMGDAGMVGLADDEGMLPRVRTSFEGFRLLREYFLMPARFHFVRFDGLAPAIRAAEGNQAEIILLCSSSDPALVDARTEDLRLFVTPIVNLFERECNIVEVDDRKPQHAVHADRSRPGDFEIYRLLRVEDAERTGEDAIIPNLYAHDGRHGDRPVFSVERRPRGVGQPPDATARRTSRPLERQAEQTRSYSGDDTFVSLAYPAGSGTDRRVRRLDIRALCTNRDLPLRDKAPSLTIETGDPVGAIALVSGMHGPLPSLAADLPAGDREGQNRDEIVWRWIAQLTANVLTVGEDGAAALNGVLSLYADRGDPVLARHARSIVSVSSTRGMERVPMPGPTCFAQGIEATIGVDDEKLTGASKLLLSALIGRLLARQAAINSFVRTTTELVNQQETVRWPVVMGRRQAI